MIIHIKAHEGPEVAKFELGNFRKIRLYADTSYEMRIYTEAGEDINFVVCEQVKKESENYVYLISPEAISILGFWQTPEKPGYEPSLPEDAEKLITRILFKVQNNAVYPKIIRWSLRIYEKDCFEAKRIPLIVKPKLKNQTFFIISTFGALLLADLYQVSSNYFAGNSIFNVVREMFTSHFWLSIDISKITNWLIHAGILFAIIFVIFFLVLRGYSRFKVSSEENHWL